MAGGALVAFLAGPGLVTVGALEAVSVVTAGSAGAVGGAVTGAVVKKSLEEVIYALRIFLNAKSEGLTSAQWLLFYCTWVRKSLVEIISHSLFNIIEYAMT